MLPKNFSSNLHAVKIKWGKRVERLSDKMIAKNNTDGGGTVGCWPYYGRCVAPAVTICLFALFKVNKVTISQKS